MTLKHQRLRAPTEHGRSLQIPPLSEFSKTLSNNRRLLASGSFFLSGESIGNVRKEARSEFLTLAREYTGRYLDVAPPGGSRDEPEGMVLAGHQPTLFHPGVWYKNFSLDRLARQHNLVGVNLVIDNDLSSHSAIRVPTGSLSDPAIQIVKFDSQSSQGPYETETCSDRTLFDSFGDRVATTVNPFVPDPLVRQLWPMVLRAMDEFENPAMAIAAGRHVFEGEIGLQTLEIPLSYVCRTRSFALFTAELLLQASRFQSIYNQSLESYRTLYRIRSSSHPVPELVTREDWIELPFWIWTRGDPKRRRLFVRQSGGQLCLADGEGLEIEWHAEDCLERMQELESAGISLRPRALLTTMYCRLVLSDVFLHGIGGATYDQLTDQIMSRFFHVDPPLFHILTATYHLPIPFQSTLPSKLTEVATGLRQLRYHPERFADQEQEGIQQWVERKSQHLANIPDTGSRKAWHDEMESINGQMQPAVKSIRDRLLKQTRELAEDVRITRMLGSRDFSFCLFDERLIKGLQS